MTGSLSVLNVGAGDINITFNQHDRREAERAIGMLKDMQKRGYAILVKLPDGSYTRAVEINAQTGSYVVLTEDITVEDEPIETKALPAGPIEKGLDDGPPLKKRRGRPPKVRTEMPIARTHAVGVARSAGG